MKTVKALFFVPLVLTALVSCGGDKQITYEDVKGRLESYATTVSQNKASSVVIGGEITSLKMKGDLYYWYYENVEGGGDESASDSGDYVANNAAKVTKEEKKKGLDFNPMTLLGLIPNLDLKNAELTVDKQKLMEAKIPSTITTIADQFNVGNDNGIMIATIANLPKFPINERLLKIINGVKVNKDTPPNKDDDDKPWYDYLQEEKWTKADVNYFDNDGGVKITIKIDHFGKFLNEVVDRISSGEGKHVKEDDYDFPLEGSLGVSNIGYINSVSLKFKNPKNIKIGVNEYMQGALYFGCDASFDIDISLYFTQQYTKQISLKYQMTEYAYDADTNTFEPTKDTKKIEPTTDLSAFKDYFTVEWLNKLDTREGKQYFDDPIFGYNYWKGKADFGKNIAFEDESYDVGIVPTYETSTEKDKKEVSVYDSYKSQNNKYLILGYKSQYYAKKEDPKSINEEGEFALEKSLNTISCNGQVIGDKVGYDDIDKKALCSACDSRYDYNAKVKEVKDEEEITHIYPVQASNLFINSTMLRDTRGEYIIDIAVYKNPNFVAKPTPTNI